MRQGIESINQVEGEEMKIRQKLSSDDPRTPKIYHAELFPTLDAVRQLLSQGRVTFPTAIDDDFPQPVLAYFEVLDLREYSKEDQRLCGMDANGEAFIRVPLAIEDANDDWDLCVATDEERSQLAQVGYWLE
jgi:hypothetical protein